MSTAKVISGVLSQIGRQSSRRCSNPLATTFMVSAKASYSTTPSPAPSSLLWHGNSAARSNHSRIYTASHRLRRGFSATSTALHGHLDPPKSGEEVYVTFIDKEGDEHKLAVNIGDNLLTVAQAHDIDMEGACEGSCSCSTCHVIVESNEMFDKMEEATDDENDMLDLAFGLTENSRLGCQIVMTKELDGLRVRLPKMTRNLRASDFKKK